MKNLIVAIVAFISIVIVAPTAALAQSGSSIVDEKEWVKRSQECNTGIGKTCGPYAGPANTWLNASACVNVINHCGGMVTSAKQAGNTSDGFKAFSRRFIRLAKALGRSIRALEDAVAANTDEIEAVKADLRRNWDDHATIRAEAKAQAEVQAKKDGEQDEEIAELKERMDDAEHGIEANRAAIARVGQKVRFDIGAALVLSSDIMGAGAVAGLNFAITDIVRAKVHAGIGASFDGEVMLLGQAGPEFLLGENRNFGLGLQALYIKEEANDRGDTFIGGGPEFSYYFLEQGYLSLLGAIGTSTRIEDAPIPDYPMRTEREWNLGWAVVFSIGFTF